MQTEHPSHKFLRDQDAKRFRERPAYIVFWYEGHEFKRLFQVFYSRQEAKEAARNLNQIDQRGAVATKLRG